MYARHRCMLLAAMLLVFSAAAQDTIPIARAGSDRMVRLEAKLSDLAANHPVYSTEVDISVGRQPLAELLRNVAKVAGANISIKGADEIMTTCNFNCAKITDLLYFVCKEHAFDIEVIGNIVSMSPVHAPPPMPKRIVMSHTIADNSLSFDLSGDSLGDVTKAITDLTGVNFIVPQTLSGQQLSGYVRRMPFAEAIGAVAAMNGLEAERDAAGVWYMGAVQRPSDDPSAASLTAIPTYSRRTPFSPSELSIDSMGLITAGIGRGQVQDIITDLCEQQRLNYYFVSSVQGETSIYVHDVDFETLLDAMLIGTGFSYYYENGIYIFGTSSQDNTITTVEVVEMKYRSVAKLSEAIPQEIASGVQIREFHDLNSVILSGNRRGVSRVKTFLRSVDRRVPLVTIEIIIVDATKQRLMDVGIDAGFGRSGVPSGGSLGGIDISLDGAGVNSLINSFNGFGSINLGRVSSGFYLDLQFLEDNGIIEMESTPKLSTLNGHQATLTSGETRYYKEIANNYYGSQIPVSTESYTWKSVDANLEIKITPLVSEDGHITLDISIDQTEFTTQEETEGPPGTSTRSFQSLIRVQNEEMVLLGGIDQNVEEQSHRGLPWIARVPVLKWFLGKSKDKKSEHRLNVFIKPTIAE